MFRDHFKEEPYFQETTSRLHATLDAARKKLQAKTHPYPMEYYALADGICDYISMAYSWGFPVQTLAAPAGEMLDAYALCIEDDDDYEDGGGLIYAQLLTMLSMGVLLNAGEPLQRLGRRLAAVGYRDYLVSYMLRYALPDCELPETLLWPEDAGCAKLMEITRSGKPAAGLQEYLDNIYYTRDNLEDDYGAHKKADNSYTGHWSFESAAMAKILGVDDALLKSSPYYPYDMVHGDSFPPGEAPVIIPVILPEIKAEAPRKKKWWQF